MKRILMMLALAAFLVAALSVSALSAFADEQTKCQRDPDFKQCEKFGPGNSENTSAFGKNPQTGVERHPGRS